MPLHKYQVIITELAEKDLDSIFAFIARTKEDAITAKKLIDDVQTKVLSLDTFPRAGSRFGDDSNTYAIHYKRYKIIYYIHEPTNRVLVLRIVHSLRNIAESS